MTDDKEWREKAERRVREYDKCERIGGNVSAYCSLFGLYAHILLKSALAELEAKEAELKEIRAIGADIADCAEELAVKRDKEIEKLKAENKKLRTAVWRRKTAVKKTSECMRRLMRSIRSRDMVTDKVYKSRNKLKTENRRLRDITQESYRLLRVENDTIKAENEKLRGVKRATNETRGYHPHTISRMCGARGALDDD